MEDINDSNAEVSTPKILRKERPRKKQHQSPPENEDADNQTAVSNEEEAETTNPEYETFDVTGEVHASRREETADASSSDISLHSSISESVKARKDRKVGLSHYINPRPASIASNQRNQVIH